MKNKKIASCDFGLDNHSILKSIFSQDHKSINILTKDSQHNLNLLKYNSELWEKNIKNYGNMANYLS